MFTGFEYNMFEQGLFKGFFQEQKFLNDYLTQMAYFPGTVKPIIFATSDSFGSLIITIPFQLREN